MSKSLLCTAFLLCGFGSLSFVISDWIAIWVAYQAGVLATGINTRGEPVSSRREGEKSWEAVS